jgi:hypothetical protein
MQNQQFEGVTPFPIQEASGETQIQIIDPGYPPTEWMTVNRADAYDLAIASPLAQAVCDGRYIGRRVAKQLDKSAVAWLRHYGKSSIRERDCLHAIGEAMGLPEELGFGQRLKEVIALMEERGMPIPCD